jgi:hypothetical protein
LSGGGYLVPCPVPSHGKGRGDEAAASELLTQAIERTRPMLTDDTTTKQRIRILWVAAKRARDLGAADVVSDAFMTLAIETNLIDRNGYWTGSDVKESRRRFGRQDVAHVIAWAQRGWNPFEKGPLT